MPVHHDVEYRIELEKKELLKMLGVGMEPEEFRQLSINQALNRDNPEKQSRLVPTRTEWLKETNGTSIIALLRTIVLQNELFLHAFRRLEEAMSTRPKPFNPADWK